MVVDKPPSMKTSKSSLEGITKKCSTLNVSDSVYLVKQQTHEELEIEIQTNRVLYVLDETIEKLKISVRKQYRFYMDFI